MDRCRKLTALVLALALAACGTAASSGSDAGTNAGLDAAAGAGADASTASGSDAALPPPATFEVTIAASCPFTKCGGDLLGTWDHTGLCLTEAEIIAPLQATCSTATVSSITASGTGRVTFLPTGHVSRKIDYTGTATLNLPSTCTLGSCATAQAALRQLAGYDTATCTGAADCACSVPISGKIDELDTYSVAGSTVKVNDHDYEYCVSGAAFTYKDVTATSPELGVGTMSKR